VKRRIVIYAVSAVISLALVLATMQMVRHYVNRIFGPPPHRHLPRVTWLVK
jgi:hypothetical protein